MPPTVPPKLRRGDTVRVVAPSMSLSVIGADNRQVVDRRFTELGLRVTFGAHVGERAAFDSTSVDSRVADLHAAFADPDVAGCSPSSGGLTATSCCPSWTGR